MKIFLCLEKSECFQQIEMKQPLALGQMLLKYDERQEILDSKISAPGNYVFF